MAGKIKTTYELLEPSEKTKADHKSRKSIIGSLFKKNRKNPSQDSTIKPDPKSSKSASSSKKDGGDLKKDDVYKKPPIEVKIEHFLDFLSVDIKSAVRPDVVELNYNVSDFLAKKFDKDSIRVLLEFLRYYDLPMQGPDSQDDEFSEAFKKEIDFFENNVFPLPKKHKLFIEKFLQIMDEDVNIKLKLFHSKNRFLRFALKMWGDDFFEDPDSICALKEIYFDSFFPLNDSWDSREEELDAFEEKVVRAVTDIRAQDTTEDLECTKNKINFFLESSFNKSSVSDKQSFLKAMQEKLSHINFSKFEISKTRRSWALMKEHILEHLDSKEELSVLRVSFNGHDVPKQDLPTVVEFLGPIIEERTGPFSGKWAFAKLPDDSKIRKALVSVVIMGLIVDGPFMDSADFSKYLEKFKHSLHQLTKEEKIEALCTEIKCGEKSLPLLPLLFLEGRSDGGLRDFFENFMPEIFDIKFKINEEVEEHNIVQLLEKMHDFFDKLPKEECLLDKQAISPYPTKISASLDKAIAILKETKEEFDDKEAKLQESKKEELGGKKEKKSSASCKKEPKEVPLKKNVQKDQEKSSKKKPSTKLDMSKHQNLDLAFSSFLFW